MRHLRAILAVAVLGLAAWLLVTLFSEPAPEATAARSFHSSRQCAECHAEVFAEWEASAHANAWANEDVRALSNDFANTDCIDCHAPRPVFETGIGGRVLPRASRRSEGVDCIACHLLPEGGVAGTIDDRSAACRPVARIELTRAEFCAGCHNQHGTVDQWRETSYADEGTSCVDCHMPLRGGDPNGGRSHGFPGGHDIDTVRSAVTLSGERAGEGWRVTVTNVAGGHHFPTDERSRASDVFWRPAGDEDAPWRFLYRFRDPYRYEVDLESTLLPHGEARVLPLEHADARGAVEVALFYMRSPYFHDPTTGEPIETEAVRDPEREAELLHRILLEP